MTPGTELFTSVPLPSWPTLFAPHVYTSPSVLRAMLHDCPPEISTILVGAMETGTRLLAVAPLPSSPELPIPQVQTRPSERKARLWR
jgi:hypothetical protein